MNMMSLSCLWTTAIDSHVGLNVLLCLWTTAVIPRPGILADPYIRTPRIVVGVAMISIEVSDSITALFLYARATIIFFSRDSRALLDVRAIPIEFDLFTMRR